MAILTALSPEQLAQTAREFGLELSRAEGVLAGSVNTNVKLTDRDGASWFLRVYEEQPLRGAEREARLVARLSREGVPTPAPRPLANGRGLVAVAAGKPACLFPFVPGQHRCQASVSAADAARVGAALARVHRVGERFRAEDGLTEPSRFSLAALFERLEQLPPSLPEQVAAARSRLLSLLEALATEPAPAPTLPLIHGDLFRDNVLFTGSGELVLLDFESASRGAAAFDFMVTVLAWCFGDRLELELARAMGRGYVSERALAEAERAALFAAARAACVRFACTRITDYELRPRGLGVYKDFRRWLARLEVVDELGPEGLPHALGL